MLTYFLLSASSIVAFLLLTRTIWILRRYKYTAAVKNEDSWPTVSVCIAARNEMHALAHCLEAVLASDYPKLEILVLDDSSEDNTPLIIKSFAQAGVRFIAGSPIPDGWLGKNHAYQTLLAESSGEIVLYIDVDTNLSVHSIHHLVNMLRSADVDMISVLPRRNDGHRTSSLLGTLRYYIELVVGTYSKPPAASAVWMVRRSRIEATNFTFSQYALSVRPERHLARQLVPLGKYKYVIGSSLLGVGYEKQLHSQYETALRLYFPIVGRSVVGWLIATLLLILLVVPFIVVLSPFALTTSSIWALLVCVVIYLAMALFSKAAYGKNVWMLRMLLTPLLLIQELLLMQVSFIQYARGKVTWKGRLVTANSKRHDALTIDE